MLKLMMPIKIYDGDDGGADDINYTNDEMRYYNREQ